MADYTTVALVRDLLPEDVRIDVSTKPNSAALSTWISQITAQVNVAMLQGGLNSSALTADQTNAIKLVSTKEAAYLVLVARGASSDAQHKPYWAEWNKEFLEMLDSIRKETWVGIATKASSYTMNAPSTTDTTINPVFARGREY